ncbi:MAG: N-acetylmuramoyl-L-alanine amidase [Myxococcota bacterium]|nr:N-acetylmuramoyl-L-alanine amidase [Myxococcota bacterium]
MSTVALRAQNAHADSIFTKTVKKITSRLQDTAEAKLVRLEVRQEALILGLELSPKTPLDDLPPEIENTLETVAGLTAALRPEIDNIMLLVRHPGGQLRPPLRVVHPSQTKPPKQEKTILPLSDYPHGQSLRGRTIAISPGHGWIYNSNTRNFRTQRGRIFWNNCGGCRGIVEDFETHEIVVNHLIPLLEGAGAKVVLVRERSLEKTGTILDENSAGFSAVNGQFSDGSSAGGHDNNYRVSTDANATAQWRFVSPENGDSLLSVWFVAGSNRYSNLPLTVQTPGFTHSFVIDQTTHGRRWSPIQTFGLNQGDEVLVTVNAPTGGNKALIADAFRLGAGQHETGHPWWQMGAKPFATYQNAPANIQSVGDVSIRPIYAEWAGADIYLSIHSNASGVAESTANGSSSYRYNCGQFSNHSSDPNASVCDDPVGSDRLQRLVHDAMVSSIRKGWDPNWRDRGTKVANFGELRNLDDMPGVLLETAFHDNVRLSQSSNLKMTDNQSLHDPRFRETLAYGIYQGISQYFGESENYLAQAPDVMFAKKIDAKTIEVHFNSVTDALSYRVYSACGHRDFDQGVMVKASPATITGLQKDEVCIFKVASLNEAGEGLRSRAITARSSLRKSQLLVIDSYERRDAWVEYIDNPGNTLATHALALREASFTFDSASESAVRNGLIDLSQYDGIILALGRESVEHEVLTTDIRKQLLNYTGAIFASGSEIAWTLDNRGDADSKQFLSEVFGASYAADSAESLELSPTSNDWFASITPGILNLDDGTGSALRARSSDVFSPETGANIALTYSGPNTAAAVRKNKNMLLGFAVDSLIRPQARSEILEAWLKNAIELAPEISPPMPPNDAGIAPPPIDAGFVDASVVEPDAEPMASADAELVLRATTDQPIRGECRCESVPHSKPSSEPWPTIILLGVFFAFRRLKKSQFHAN